MADILAFGIKKRPVIPHFLFRKTFFRFSNNEKYDLRNNGINFQLDKPKTNFLKKSISYSGAKCWIAGIICQMAQMRLRQKK
jgi:hypothetical protein